MRLLPVLLLLPLFALPAHAQTPPAPPAPAAAPAAPAPARAKPHRMSWKERFARANVTHDGHLTRQQAEQGYRTIARHFAEIDASKKGYITVEDIAAWHKLQRAMHHHRQDQDSHALHPRPAMQHGMAAPQEYNTSTDTKVAPMTQPGTQSNPADASDTSPRHGT